MPERPLLIVTGASRGLGAALAECALDAGYRVLAIARSRCAHGESITADLADTAGLESTLRPRLDVLAEGRPARAVLVNNAATVAPIGSDYDIEAADRHLRLNLLAPIALTRLFLRSFAEVADRRIINISSGAAVRAFDGWSLYCAAKAGLDHFARCVALEQQREPRPADIVNVSPGVIDTDMQAAIRASAADAFPDRERFVALQRDGELASPRSVALKLLAGLARDRRHAGATLGIDAFAGD